MFGATKRLAMLGQVPLLGQINGGGYSWNTAPGGWNPYAATPPAQSQTYGGAPAAQAPASPAGSCFTCVNGSTGDAQYGVPAAMANQLKNQGYRCRADDCAGRPQAAIPQGALPPSFPGMVNYGSMVSAPVSSDFTSYGGGGDAFYGMMGRMRVQGGIGRRAFGGW